jgi:site-specific DNA-methyltransferase (adenine-specific)/site-specific DNA-methyltransferase (cytosine-N4-specific)
VPGRWAVRLANGWERLLHFAKDEKIAFYREQVMVPITRPRNYTNERSIRHYSRTGSGYSFNRSCFRGRTMKYPSNVLHLPCVTRNYGHSAAYPESIPTFFIKLFTREGDLILDPFVGSGTTCVAATTLNRESIGIDIKLSEGARERVRAARTQAASRGHVERK